MRACVQCGLSIGVTATFCPVCGATAEPAVPVEVAAVTVGAGGDQSAALAGPAVRPAPGVGLAPAARSGPYAEPSDAGFGPAGAVAAGEPAAEVEAADDPEPEAESGPPAEVEPAAEAEVEPATVEGPPAGVEPAADPERAAEAESAAEPVAEAQPAVVAGPLSEADLEALPAAAAGCPAVTEAGPEVDTPPEAEGGPEAEAEPAEVPGAELDRRMMAVSALLQDAAACEDSDAAHAAGLLQQAVIGCLDATEDPLGEPAVRRDLLESLDCLSALLERQGLPDEALAVVDDAASLGLLEGGEVAVSHREALRERREALRRVLFVDSAHL